MTVAVLVNFPPEPFYVPNVTALDYALRYRSKAGKKGTRTCGLTLERDGQWDDPAAAYKRLKLKTYHHSVLVQELMRSHHWPAFKEERWGNRFNPPIPEGDVRPPRTVTAAQPRLDVIELPPTTTSENLSSLWNSHLPAHSLRQISCPPLTERNWPKKKWSSPSLPLRPRRMPFAKCHRAQRWLQLLPTWQRT